MADRKPIAFCPEAAFGSALNSVGIALACEARGHRAVFICDPGFGGVFAGYGFEEFTADMSAPMPPEEMAKYWSDFINGHIPNFGKTPYDQIDNYVKECWEAIVDAAVWAEKELPQILDTIKPDFICIGNVVLFPATKRYGAPWVRIISCSENEVPTPTSAPPLGLRRGRSRRLRALPRLLQRGRRAHPRQVQRLPRRMRRSALSGRRVLRDLAPPQPPALPRAGQVQAPPPARPGLLPVPRGLRARGGALYRARLRSKRRRTIDIFAIRKLGLGRHGFARAHD